MVIIGPKLKGCTTFCACLCLHRIGRDYEPGVSRLPHISDDVDNNAMDERDVREDWWKFFHESRGTGPVRGRTAVLVLDMPEAIADKILARFSEARLVCDTWNESAETSTCFLFASIMFACMLELSKLAWGKSLSVPREKYCQIKFIYSSKSAPS